MRITLARRAGGAAVLLTVAVLACQQSPTRPGTPPIGRTGRHLQITGPSTVPPDGTAQLKATLFEDGVSRDVTNTARWSVGDRRLSTITDTGLVEGHAVGDVMITAEAEGQAAFKPLIVLPNGTYRVLGAVRESGVTMPITDARVEVRMGAATVLESVTDAEGKFKLYGVPSGGELRITRNGYVPYAQTITLTDHASVNVDLVLAAPRPDISGTYTLTIGSINCSNTVSLLPAELRRRTYAATVTQNAARLKVTLTGVEFRSIRGVPANEFSGTFEPPVATFQLTRPGYYYLYSPFWQKPDVVEEFPDAVGLLISGKATMSLSSSGLSGTLDGSLEMFKGPVTLSPSLGSCVSKTHPFVLSR